ncbi:hypothetical protein JKA74_20300 [Marivirga sp. S37H4]|uniref:Lipoprotein n=1 Tax=Marivirga aurantiaca TaxID=2802615 RepID=A0A934X2X4_9BACT|nr:hypothetical protein [Marivirga aurantiaca]MBK6267395.1 hypothetical protein [Marivirga aurantiaca]
MDFRKVIKCIFFLVVIFSFTACSGKSTKTSIINQQDSIIDNDTIVFKNSNKKYKYISTLVYQFDKKNGGDSINKELISLEKAGDSIFAFMDGPSLYNQNNQNLPYYNDTIINTYAKNFDIEIDDDIPYIVYLRNDQDFIQFIRKNSGVYYLETATIRSSYIEIFKGIKNGMSKTEVFNLLKFPNQSVDMENFNLILCHVSVPSKTAFKNESFSSVDTKPAYPTIQLNLHFMNNKLKYIYMDSWIGYGDMGDDSFVE